MEGVFKPISKPDVVIFVSQVLLLFIVVITSLVNLTLDKGNTNLWTMVLTSCLGYMMPNPRMKSSKSDESTAQNNSNGVVLRDFAVERNEHST